jgi:4-hydroxy-tetrahydrodipicolinate synthase
MITYKEQAKENNMFHGSIVALITPFLDDRVDTERLRELVEYHIEHGTNAIVAAGTTGESGTLNQQEKILVFKTVIDQVKERIPVIAATSHNATKECIQLTKTAMECGAHAVLIMTPAYIKPTQEGLYQHYRHIAEAVPIPIILYNVPSRTNCDLLPETVARLNTISNIIGIKEASGKSERLQQLLAIQPNPIDVYSGDDANAAEWILAGAKGVISVSANIVPKRIAKLCDAALDGDRELSLKLDAELAPLHDQLFVESNPIPVKWAAHKMGLLNDEIRLPMTRLSEQHRPKLEAILNQLGLI